MTSSTGLCSGETSLCPRPSNQPWHQLWTFRWDLWGSVRLAQVLTGWGWTRAEISVAPGTLLPAQVPYNMERIFWLLSGSDSQGTRALMEQFERTQSTSLPKELHSKVSHHSRTRESKGGSHETQLGFGNLVKGRGHLFLEHLNEAGHLCSHFLWINLLNEEAQ